MAREVVVGHEADAGQQREEAAMVLLLAGGGERAEGAAVERAVRREDLVAPAAVLGAPAARQLHRRLDRPRCRCCRGRRARRTSAGRAARPARPRSRCGSGSRRAAARRPGGGWPRPRPGGSGRGCSRRRRRRSRGSACRRRPRASQPCAAHERQRLARVEADLVRGVAGEDLGAGHALARSAARRRRGRADAAHAPRCRRPGW